MHVDSGVRAHGDLLGLRADGIARATGRQHPLPSDVNLAVGSGLGTTRDIAHTEAMRKRPHIKGYLSGRAAAQLSRQTMREARRRSARHYVDFYPGPRA